MDDFAPLGLFRSECFSDVSDDESDSFNPLELDADVYRSVGGGCMVASAPEAWHFGPVETAFQNFPEPQPKQFTKAKNFEPSLECDDFDLTQLWDFPQQLQSRPEPKQEPEWVNPHSSLVSDEDASTLLDEIQAIISNHWSETVSFEVSARKFKIKAISCQGALPTEFSIRLFKGNTAKVVVEWHRTNGCARAFFSVFRQVTAALGSRVRMYSGEELFFDAPAPLPPVPTTICQPAPALAVSTLINTLMLMIRSGEFLDVQKQAFAELVVLSLEHCAALAKQKEELVPMLLSTLRSTDAELVRCAAMVLANLAGVEQQKLSWSKPEDALIQMEGVLRLPSSPINNDTKKHMARAMVDVMAAGGVSSGMQERFHRAASTVSVC